MDYKNRLKEYQKRDLPVDLGYEFEEKMERYKAIFRDVLFIGIIIAGIVIVSLDPVI